jgi:glycosyltransferase involved in cell wall biosynthesis
MAKYLFIMANEGNRWGGSEPLWSKAAEKLARRGNEVRVSAKDWGEPVPEVERLREAGCQIFYRNDSLPPFFTRQIRRIFPKPEFHRGHVQAAASGVDLIVISQGANWDGLLWIEAAQATGRNYALIAQSAVVYWWPDDDFAKRVAKGYENARATYFVSQANLELSRKQFSSPLPNAKVVRNPFSVRYGVQCAWPDGPADGLALASVGRLDVISKAQDVLLEVLALPHWRERKACVSLIGSGPNERSLRHIAERLKLKSVRFVGHQEDIEGVWKNHHALVLPSRFEGMPLTVVEAMLCGRPCIVSDVGGNRELVRDGVNGFLAKAPTVELFDEAMNRAWENRHRLQEMGEQAAQDVRAWVGPDPAEDFANELERLVETFRRSDVQTFRR